MILVQRIEPVGKNESKMNKKILVTLDGSKRAESILPHVNRLASCLNFDRYVVSRSNRSGAGDLRECGFWRAAAHGGPAIPACQS